MWGGKPLTWAQEQRQYRLLLDALNDTSGRFPLHKLGIDLGFAVSGADTLATAKRLRSEDLGPENTLKGALNRIGRAVLGKLDYGVGLSSDVYMKAYNFIRQHHPALMTKLAPVFEFIDRVRNTDGSLRHRFVSKGVAAFHLLGSLLNDIATATQPGQLSPAFAMAGHSGGGGPRGRWASATTGGGSGGGSARGQRTDTSGLRRRNGIERNGGPRRPYIPRSYTHDPNRPSPLAKHEAQYSTTGGNGYLIEKHVGKIIQELTDRFKRDARISASSSFPDIQTAERAVTAMLPHLQDKIERLQKGLQDSTMKTVNVGFDVGLVVYPNTMLKRKTNWVTIVLNADSRMPEGYYIETAFPAKGP